MASRTNKASVKVGGADGVDGGVEGDVVLVGGDDVGVLADGGSDRPSVGVGIAVSTARAEGVKVGAVVGTALGAMVCSPGACGRSGRITVGAQVGEAEGGDTVVADGIER